MAFLKHLRISFGGGDGESGETNEIWECTVNAEAAVGDVEAFNCDSYLAGVAGPLAAWFSAGASGMSSGETLTYIKCNPVGPDGKYLNLSHTFVHDYTAVVAGGKDPVVPSTSSLCFQWTTAVTRGPGKLGRIFPPNPTYGDPTRETVAGTDQTAAVAAGKALLNTLAGTSDFPNIVPVVASNVNATNSVITGVKVGSIRNTQRLRKDALTPHYVQVAYP